MQAAGPDPWPGGCGCGSGDPVSTSPPMTWRPRIAWPWPGPDHGGARCSGGPPRPQLARRDPAMIAAAHEPVDARPPPAVPAKTSGGHRAAAGSPGLRPPVTASRAEMIAASSGRARQQRTRGDQGSGWGHGRPAWRDGVHLPGGVVGPHAGEDEMLCVFDGELTGFCDDDRGRRGQAAWCSSPATGCADSPSPAASPPGRSSSPGHRSLIARSQRAERLQPVPRLPGHEAETRNALHRAHGPGRAGCHAGRVGTRVARIQDLPGPGRQRPHPEPDRRPPEFSHELGPPVAACSSDVRTGSRTDADCGAWVTSRVCPGATMAWTHFERRNQ